MTNSVLITGASGLIGGHLVEKLLQKGCRVSQLGRAGKAGVVPAYHWDPDTGYFDRKALQGVDTIVNLAGAGIADKRWTTSRKAEILDSRVKSARLLRDTLLAGPHSVKTVIAVSAIGYYGAAGDQHAFTEEDAPGTDFLASVVKQWEQEIQPITEAGIRLVTLRVGVVLNLRGGALPEIMRPIRFGLGAPLGNGKQLVSWIHIDDLCELFAWAIDHPVQGIFNAVAPEAISNLELTRKLARRLKRPLLLPPVPGFLMRLALGEMAGLVLSGSRVSSARVIREGFRFRFPNCDQALDNLMAIE